VCLHYYWPYKRGTSQAQQSHRVLCHNDSLTKLSTENLIHGHYFLTFHGDYPLLPSSSAAQKLRSALLETNPHWVLWKPFHCDQLTGLVSNLSSLLQLAVLVTPAFFCVCVKDVRVPVTHILWTQSLNPYEKRGIDTSQSWKRLMSFLLTRLTSSLQLKYKMLLLGPLVNNTCIIVVRTSRHIWR